MPKTLTSHCNFNCGEVSPKALGRFDQQKYPNFLKTMENFLPTQIGGALFRPGSYYAGTTKTASKKTRLMRFSFSTTQNYIVEVGDYYFRFWANNGQLLTGGTPVEVVTPYAVADIFKLHKTQNADTMYITCQSYAPYKLQRTSATSFTLTKVSFIRGPFLDNNITKITLTPSAATGNITVTATIPAWGTGNAYVSGPDLPDYVTNGGSTYQCLISHVGETFATDLAAGYWVLVTSTPIFQAGHVGSLWKIHSAVVQITAYTSGTVVSASVQAEPEGVAGNIGGTSAYTDWAEGQFSSIRGFPATCTFYQQRLFYASTTYKPQTFFGSNIGAYDNFKVDANDASAAVTYEIVDEEVNAIRWMASCPQSLQCGTSGGTFSAAGTSSDAMSGTNPPIVNNDTNFGVASIQPEKISSYLYYLQSNLFQLRELFYNYLVNRQLAADMNKFADHVLRDGGGAVDMAHQQSPNDRIWVVRADGQLAVLIRNPEEDIMGWSRQTSGITASGSGLYESIAIIPTDGGDDQIWVIVKRIVNGSVVRFVEYFTSESFTDPWDANRLDASLTYDSPKLITAATQASPVVITSASHGFSNGYQIKIDNVAGMTDLNGNIYIVTNATTDTFQLFDEDGVAIDGTLFGKYLSGGEVRKMISTFTGLDHLNGEYVSVQADGVIPAAQQTFLVAAGSITLAIKAAVVHIGLPYIGNLVICKISEGGQGRMRRIYEIYMRLHQTLGLNFGRTLASIKPMVVSTIQSPPPGHSTTLFTGDYKLPTSGGWATDDEIVIQQQQPLPALILAVIIKSEWEARE